jgi:hypothetical protein
VIPDLPSPVAVVCHDAGAANIIQSWIATQPTRDWRAVMAGPAARSWTDLGFATPILPTLESALAGAAVLLSGTGWASELEHNARKLARMRGIHTIAVLDHWVNYKERFVRNGEMVLPDAIYVTDEYALIGAQKIFPNIPISQYENKYFETQLSELQRLEIDRADVLYLLEPIRADWPRYTLGEFEALEYFLENMGKLNIPSGTAVRLRPHPSDPPGKYIRWLASHAAAYPNVMLDENNNLARSMARARWIAGCETNAMVIALFSGRTVISTLPPWAPPCRLPHRGIIRIRDLPRICSRAYF